MQLGSHMTWHKISPAEIRCLKLNSHFASDTLKQNMQKHIFTYMSSHTRPHTHTYAHIRTHKHIYEHTEYRHKHAVYTDCLVPVFLWLLTLSLLCCFMSLNKDYLFETISCGRIWLALCYLFNINFMIVSFKAILSGRYLNLCITISFFHLFDVNNLIKNI